MLRIALFPLLIGVFASSLFASTAHAEKKRPHQVVFSYLKPQNSNLIGVYTAFSKEKILEYSVDLLGEHIRLPRDIQVVLKECGSNKAWYDRNQGAIFLCYEFYTFLEDSFKHISKAPASRAQAQEVIDRSLDTMTFVLYHELGHALIHQLQLPVLGKEEDAADQIATAVLTRQGKTGSQKIISVAMHFSYLAEQFSAKGNSINDLPFWNEHSLDAQRMYSIICLIYGSNPEAYVNLLGQGGLPRARAVQCPGEYQNFMWSFITVLQPYKMPAN